MSDFFVHESAYVDEDVTIGSGTKIWHFCHVQSGARIGAGAFSARVNIANDVATATMSRFRTMWQSTPGPLWKMMCFSDPVAC